MRRHECFRLRGLRRFSVGTRHCAVVYFALAIALWTVTGIAWRLTAILAFISRSLSNQDIDQRRMDRILTFFRTATFRAYRRRHMNFTLFVPTGIRLPNTVANWLSKSGELRTAKNGSKARLVERLSAVNSLHSNLQT